MANHLTEEEQIEAFKQWWVGNGLKLVATAVILVGGYFGFNGWQDSQQAQVQKGSAIYTSMIDSLTTQTDQPLSDEQKTAIQASADQLKEEFGDSGYANLSALIKAKLAVNAGDLDQAASELEWALNNDPADNIQAVATLRLARIEAARGNAETALALVNDQDAGEMTSVYEEAKGDFHIMLGHYEAAYTAYQIALDTEQTGNPRVTSILRLKLSEAKPAANSGLEQPNETQGES